MTITITTMTEENQLYSNRHHARLNRKGHGDFAMPSCTKKGIVSAKKESIKATMAKRNGKEQYRHEITFVCMEIILTMAVIMSCRNHW